MTDGVGISLKAESDLVSMTVADDIILAVKIYLCDRRIMKICIDADIPKNLGSDTASELMELLMKQGFEKTFNGRILTTMRKCIKVNIHD